MLKIFLFHFDFSASFSPCLQPLYSFLPAFSLIFFSFSPRPPQEILGALPSFSKFGGCKCCSDRFAGSFSIENGSVERCAKNKRDIVICFLSCCQKDDVTKIANMASFHEVLWSALILSLSHYVALY